MDGVIYTYLFFIIAIIVYFLRAKRLDRYILKNISKAFLVGVLLVLIVMISQLLFEISDLIIVEKVALGVVLRYLLYQLPAILSQTFPIAVLFAVMTTIGTLSSNNEITAMQMGGKSLFGLLIPVIIFGLLISISTIVINESIVPWANLRSRKLIRSHIDKDTGLETEEDMVFRDENLIYYIQEMESGDELKNIIIYRLKEREGFPDMITASSGQVKGTDWNLRNAQVFNYNENGSLEFQSRGKEMNFETNRDPKTLYEDWRSPQEMSREKLKETIETFRKSGLNTNRLLTDYHLKLASPLFGIVFALIGFSLSLRVKNSSLNKVLIIKTVFLYYIALSVFRSLGRNSVLPPLSAAWLPIIIFALVGIAMLLWEQNLKRRFNLSFSI
ncbi:MAG: LptF/LptG family permease [Patescibacteria group bacterium]